MRVKKNNVKTENGGTAGTAARLLHFSPLDFICSLYMRSVTLQVHQKSLSNLITDGCVQECIWGRGTMLHGRKKQKSLPDNLV